MSRVFPPHPGIDAGAATQQRRHGGERGQLLGRRLDLDDLEFQRRRYDNDSAYRQAKQADRI